MPADSPENKCPEPESQVAVHPVWGCDNEAIKDEFRRLQAERDKYLEWFQKADSELERLHFENEQREAGIELLKYIDRIEEFIGLVPGWVIDLWNSTDPDLPQSLRDQWRESGLAAVDKKGQDDG